MDSRTLGRGLLLAVVILSVGALAYKRLAPGSQVPEGPATLAESGPVAESVAVSADTTFVSGTMPDPAAVPPRETAPADQVNTPAAPKAPPAPVIQVVYFHTNFRCQTCTAIEVQSGQAVERAFARELESGRLTWATCNLDKAGNEHFEKDFDLTSASLVLTDGRGPKGRWKVLEKTWDLVGDSTAFSDYVLGETRAFLAAAR